MISQPLVSLKRYRDVARGSIAIVARTRYGATVPPGRPFARTVTATIRPTRTRRAERGFGKPETFNFLGFTMICGKSRQGRFLLKRRTRRDRMRVKLQEIKGELRRRMHQPIPDQGQWLGQVVTGFFAYHAVPPNFPALRLSGSTRSASGDACVGGAARRTASRGNGSRSWPPTFFPSPAFSTPGSATASPSNIGGGSRMRESRTYGSVRGALSNGRPYRDPLSGMPRI